MNQPLGYIIIRWY